jgi:hypothetical protein
MIIETECYELFDMSSSLFEFDKNNFITSVFVKFQKQHIKNSITINKNSRIDDTDYDPMLTTPQKYKYKTEYSIKLIINDIQCILLKFDNYEVAKFCVERIITDQDINKEIMIERFPEVLL